MIILCAFCFILFQKVVFVRGGEKNTRAEDIYLIFSWLYFLVFLFFKYYFLKY